MDDSRSSTQGTPDTSVAWYKPDVGTIPGEAAKLLEQYSNIPPDKLVAHMSSVVS